jgi:hypothetical protein
MTRGASFDFLTAGRLVAWPGFTGVDPRAIGASGKRANIWPESLRNEGKNCAPLRLQNELGYHLGDGATTVMIPDEEYRDIFPPWDWRRVPCVSAVQNPGPRPSRNTSGAAARRVGATSRAVFPMARPAPPLWSSQCACRWKIRPRRVRPSIRPLTAPCSAALRCRPSPPRAPSSLCLGGGCLPRYNRIAACGGFS